MTDMHREAFEAWAVKEGWPITATVYMRTDDGYGVYDLSNAWLGWQAAMRYLHEQEKQA